MQTSLPLFLVGLFGSMHCDPTTLIIYGGGGHGKALIELVPAMRTFDIAGILDDGLPTGSQILGVPLLGGGDLLPALSEQSIRLAVNAVGGIGTLGVRVRVFDRLAQAGFTCPAVVHPPAVVEASASLAAGVQIFAQAYVGSEARLGFGAIVNTSAIISHDCELGKFVNISPGAILAGEVRIGDGVLIGMVLPAQDVFRQRFGCLRFMFVRQQSNGVAGPQTSGGPRAVASLRLRSGWSVRHA